MFCLARDLHETCMTVRSRYDRVRAAGAECHNVRDAGPGPLGLMAFYGQAVDFPSGISDVGFHEAVRDSFWILEIIELQLRRFR
jgi:hypothetical protein